MSSISLPSEGNQLRTVTRHEKIADIDAAAQKAATLRARSAKSYAENGARGRGPLIAVLLRLALRHQRSEQRSARTVQRGFSMRIVVDLNLCQAYAQCCFLAPDVFTLRGDEVLLYKPEPDEMQRLRVLRSAAACPVRAILVEEEHEGGAL